MLKTFPPRRLVASARLASAAWVVDSSRPNRVLDSCVDVVMSVSLHSHNSHQHRRHWVVVVVVVVVVRHHYSLAAG